MEVRSSLSLSNALSCEIEPRKESGRIHKGIMTLGDFEIDDHAIPA